MVEVKGVFLHFHARLGHPLERESRTVGVVFWQTCSWSIAHPPTFLTKAWCSSDWLKKPPIWCAVTTLSWHWLIQLWYSSCSGRRSQKILKASHMVSWHTVRTRGETQFISNETALQNLPGFSGSQSRTWVSHTHTHSSSCCTHKQGYLAPLPIPFPSIFILTQTTPGFRETSCECKLSFRTQENINPASSLLRGWVPPPGFLVLELLRHVVLCFRFPQVSTDKSQLCREQKTCHPSKRRRKSQDVGCTRRDRHLLYLQRCWFGDSLHESAYRALIPGQLADMCSSLSTQHLC